MQSHGCLVNLLLLLVNTIAQKCTLSKVQEKVLTVCVLYVFKNNSSGLASPSICMNSVRIPLEALCVLGFQYLPDCVGFP